MLTGRGKAGPLGPIGPTPGGSCKDVKCTAPLSKKQDVNFWETNKQECCEGLTCGTAVDGTNQPYNCGDYGTLKNNPKKIGCDTFCTQEICCDRNPVGKSCTAIGAPKCKAGTQKTTDKSKTYTNPADHQTKCCEPNGGQPQKAMCCATSTNRYDNTDPTNPVELQCKNAGAGKEASCGLLDPIDCKWTIPTAQQMTKFGCKVPAGKCCNKTPDGKYDCSTTNTTKKECDNDQSCRWDETGQCNTENFRMRRWRR
jgi:hypothetical protein